MKTAIEMARIAGARDDGQRSEFELRDLEFLVALVYANEREACAKLADKVEYCGACKSDVARAIQAMGRRAVGNRAYDRYEGDNT